MNGWHSCLVSACGGVRGARRTGVWRPDGASSFRYRDRYRSRRDQLPILPHTLDTYRCQAEKWIYPRAGNKKLADFKATDAVSIQACCLLPVARVGLGVDAPVSVVMAGVLGNP